MVILVTVLFVLGYVAIVMEHSLRINKAASALVTAVLCWTAYALFTEDKEMMAESLTGHLGELSGILFFLLGAMVIVELIDAHDGFEFITEKITTTNKKKLVWIIGLFSFFLSAVLDNLTTTIVMVSLLRKIIPEHRDRLLFAGLVVIAANAGGAWSPIGDVTTTMLWIGGQVSAGNIIIKTIVPSLICFLVPAFVISARMKGKIEAMPPRSPIRGSTASQRNGVFFLGVAVLLFVPIFKTITHLPPYLGILLGLGVMWIITEMIHSGKDEADRDVLTVNYALRKIDSPSILFFLGILLAVSTLEVTGVLHHTAEWMDRTIGDIRIITVLIGLLSALVDNVPLVAAAQGMYSLEQFPKDHYFWEFMAYCAGTGGSCLIIGSAAGVAAMGMEKIDFFWYLKNISWLALIGYLAGAVAFLLQLTII